MHVDVGICLLTVSQMYLSTKIYEGYFNYAIF